MVGVLSQHPVPNCTRVYLPCQDGYASFYWSSICNVCPNMADASYEFQRDFFQNMFASNTVAPHEVVEGSYGALWGQCSPAVTESYGEENEDNLSVSTFDIELHLQVQKGLDSAEQKVMTYLFAAWSVTVEDMQAAIKQTMIELGVTQDQVPDTEKALKALNIICKVYKECSAKSCEKSLLGKLKRGIQDVIVMRLLCQGSMGDREGFLTKIQGQDLDIRSCVINAAKKIWSKGFPEIQEEKSPMVRKRPHNKKRPKNGKKPSESHIMEDDYLLCFEKYYKGQQTPNWKIPEWVDDCCRNCINLDLLSEQSSDSYQM